MSLNAGHALDRREGCRAGRLRPVCLLLFGAWVALGFGSAASAVPIVNPGFEDLMLQDGEVETTRSCGPRQRVCGPDPTPGWTVIRGYFGTSNPSVELFANEAPEGKNIVFGIGLPSRCARDPANENGCDGTVTMAPSVLSQILSTPLESGIDYELRVEVGNRLPGRFPLEYAIELRAGGVLLAVENGLDPSPGTFETSVIRFTARPGDPIGQSLQLRLRSNGVYFDNVRLIPEPSTVLLLAVGLIGIAAWPAKYPF